MTIEEKRLEVLKKRISMLKDDTTFSMNRDAEYMYYGGANYKHGKVDGLDSVLTIIDIVYGQCTEEDLDEWIDFKIED